MTLLSEKWTQVTDEDETIVLGSFSEVLHFFQESPLYPKIIWRSRNHNCIYFGLGIGKTHSTHTPSFMVNAFDPTQPQWEHFPSSLHWTPYRLMKLQWTQDTTLDAMQSISLFQGTSVEEWQYTSSSDTTPSHREVVPNQQNWCSHIETAKSFIHQNKLQKIVLAREAYFPFHNPWAKFIQLLAQHNCYQFLWQPNANKLFLGSSPEQLFCLQNQTLYTEALAGTKEVSQNKNETSKAAIHLTHSPKDQAEHAFVVDYIQNALMELSESIEQHPQEILELPHVQHLRTPLTFQIRKDVSIQEILDRLHPTPAVCGIPAAEAKAFIADIEPFHRGWYAGTMGIIENDKIDFTVLIRSALWRNGDGYAWSGAGIVAASDANAEWVEISNKAKQFLSDGKPT